ncbi:radical SAM protein [Thermoproteota archaeon]
MLSKRDCSYTKKIERLLSRYFSYKDLAYERLCKEKQLDPKTLISKVYDPPDRLILLVTHKCQLRCKYCKVRKFSASMNEDVMRKAVNWLFTSSAKEVQIQFFGGEPLLRFDIIKKAVEHAEKISKRTKKRVEFLLTTNGIALTKEKIKFIKGHDFTVEYSIDGEIENQLKSRSSPNGKKYYSKMLENFRNLEHADITHYSISVFTPETVGEMFNNFRHLIDLGFKNLQINYALGVLWHRGAFEELIHQTRKITSYIRKRSDITFMNFTSSRKEPVVLNAELTTDTNGGVYLESGICLEEDFIKMKNNFCVTHLKSAKNICFYGSSQFQNFYRLSKIYAKQNTEYRKIILNNIAIGKRYDAFLKNMRKRLNARTG